MSHYSDQYEHDAEEQKLKFKVTHWQDQYLGDCTKSELRYIIDELAEIVEEERQELKRRTETLLKIGRN